MKDILANPHPTTPYEVLKDRLLNNHSLTDFQKIERQFKIRELGPQQKPSELLAHLVELTPADELESKYLIFLFIQRLPKILRMQLGDDLDRISEIFQRERTAFGPFTPTTWRLPSRRWPRRSRRMRRAARPASLWPPSPPSTRRNSSTSTPAAAAMAPRAATPPRPSP
jgi:hypothetical protein